MVQSKSGFFANIVHFFQHFVEQKTISTVHKYASSTCYPIFSPAEVNLVRLNRKYVLTEYVLTELFAMRYIGIKFRQKRQVCINRVYVISRVRTNRVLLYI